jgi:hypothetical protein
MRKIKRYNNAILVRSKNKRISIERIKENKNAIYITSLTSETGKGISAITKLSENEKIKYSLIGFTDEAIKDLYICLHRYINDIL